jgi:glycosyltransferase involved in cell wall biosynthesis
VAQSQVSWLGKFARVAVMAYYLDAQYRAILAEARERGADVIHAHWAIPTGPAAVMAARKLRAPSVITMHGGDVYVNPEQGYDFPTRWYVRPALGWTLRHAGALTAITDDCRQHALRAGAPADRIRLVFNGTDLRRFSPHDNGTPGDQRFGPNMIFACRQLFPRKGIRFLLEAAAQLKPQFPDLKIVLAGDGFERPALVQLAQELGIGGDVTFLGWVPNTDLPPYYRAAAVSVIPSLEEGFGIPAAEAMGCEVPVVASDAGGLPEVVEDGVTGLVVPRGDSTALARAIGSLLADPERRRQMGRAGRARALRLFDWDRSAEQFEELYREVAARISR